MLILSRPVGEAIAIGDNIVVKVIEIKGSQVRLAFDAPREIPILRTELLEREPNEKPTDTA